MVGEHPLQKLFPANSNIQSRMSEHRSHLLLLIQTSLNDTVLEQQQPFGNFHHDGLPGQAEFFQRIKLYIVFDTIVDTVDSSFNL